MTANSPRAEKYRELERQTRERAEAHKITHGVGDDDATVRYLLSSAEYWARRAAETQNRADRRARLRAEKS